MADKKKKLRGGSSLEDRIAPATILDPTGGDLGEIGNETPPEEPPPEPPPEEQPVESTSGEPPTDPPPEETPTEPPPEGDGTPVEGEGTPVEGEGAPVEGSGTPAEGEGTPAEGDGTPAEGDGTPDETVGPDGAPDAPEGESQFESTFRQALDETGDPNAAFDQAADEAINGLIEDGATQEQADQVRQAAEDAFNATLEETDDPHAALEAANQAAGAETDSLGLNEGPDGSPDGEGPDGSPDGEGPDGSPDGEGPDGSPDGPGPDGYPDGEGPDGSPDGEGDGEGGFEEDFRQALENGSDPSEAFNQAADNAINGLLEDGATQEQADQVRQAAEDAFNTALEETGDPEQALSAANEAAGATLQELGFDDGGDGGPDGEGPDGSPDGEGPDGSPDGEGPDGHPDGEGDGEGGFEEDFRQAIENGSDPSEAFNQAADNAINGLLEDGATQEQADQVRQAAEDAFNTALEETGDPEQAISAANEAAGATLQELGLGDSGPDGEGPDGSPDGEGPDGSPDGEGPDGAPDGEGDGEGGFEEDFRQAIEDGSDPSEAFNQAADNAIAGLIEDGATQEQADQVRQAAEDAFNAALEETGDPEQALAAANEAAGATLQELGLGDGGPDGGSDGTPDGGDGPDVGPDGTPDGGDGSGDGTPDGGDGGDGGDVFNSTFQEAIDNGATPEEALQIAGDAAVAAELENGEMTEEEVEQVRTAVEEAFNAYLAENPGDIDGALAAGNAAAAETSAALGYGPDSGDGGDGSSGDGSSGDGTDGSTT